MPTAANTMHALVLPSIQGQCTKGQRRAGEGTSGQGSEREGKFSMTSSEWREEAQDRQ